MTYRIQIDNLERDATADETAFIDAQHAASKARDKANADKAKAKAALLDKLGITADEAALLLG